MDTGSVKVLVVAPEFPLINQPWMDTYLEQFQKNDVPFKVFSLNQHPKVYGKKVDRLGFLQYTYSFCLDKKALLSTILKKFRPIIATRLALKLHRNGTLHSLPAWKLLLNALHFAAIADNFADCTVIHSHSESLSYRFIILAEMLNLPLVVTFHGLPPAGVPQLSENKRKALYGYAKRVIVNTEFAKRQVMAFGCEANKVTILPQGLPIEDFPFQPAPYPAAGEPLRILSVGRFHRDKGQHYSLLALKRLVNDGLNVRWTFTGSGPGLGKLKKLCKQLELESRVTFLEGVSSQELLALYHQAHIFVLASIDTPGGHVETQGVVLQEAQATGSIVIATRTGGIPDCLNDGVDSILVKQQSSQDIYKATLRLLESKENWPSLRKSARKNVEQRFNSAVVGQKMKALLVHA